MQILIVIQPQLSRLGLQEKIALSIIDQREAWPQADALPMSAQQLGAEGVEGADRGRDESSGQNLF